MTSDSISTTLTKRIEDSRENNFGFLRIFFASLVIISHSPELIDGNRSREILTRIFGTISFGEFAVDGFFLISGYLITKSFTEKRSISSYFSKRIFRIVPGFLVTFWICLLVVPYFVSPGHSALAPWEWRRNIANSLLLLPPQTQEDAFPGLPYPILNGSLWTIAYEFRCYLLTAVLGSLGMFQSRQRLLMIFSVGALVVLNGLHVFAGISTSAYRFIGTPSELVRLTAVYGVGTLFFLLRDKIPLNRSGAISAAALLLLLLFHSHFAETALMLCGGYLIFWFAFHCPVLRLSRAENRNDISYGLYLYAWPIQSLAIWFDRDINPWALAAFSLVTTGMAAYASWKLVEQPCLNLSKRRPPKWVRA